MMALSFKAFSMAENFESNKNEIDYHKYTEGDQ